MAPPQLSQPLTALLVGGHEVGGVKLTGYHDQEDKGTQSQNLSKRTALYAHLTTVSNGADAALGFNSPVAGRQSNGLQVGVRHRF